ncbi:MAG: SH3 domain-containing protein [Rhodospirillales bacterium]|nr:SH3 domain-containing protein [Rhodospirillales bacterium]
MRRGAYLVAIGLATAAAGPAWGQAGCDKVDPAEAAFWDSIKNSRAPEDHKAYLDTFPNGCYAALARVRVNAAPTTTAPTPLPTATPPAPKPPPSALDIEPLDRDSFVTGAANVRAAPSTEAEKVETLAAGSGIAVTGRVRGTDWYRVARDGRDIGFVFGPLLAEFGAVVRAPPSQQALATPGQPGLAAEALRKCPAAGSAQPLYSQYDQASQAFAQQFGPALSAMMQAFQGQASGFLRQFNAYGFNAEAFLQQALGSLQRDVQAMQRNATLRQQIEQQERRDLEALQACARSRAISRQEALAVVQEREAKLAEHQRAEAQSRQLVQQRRQDYERTVAQQSGGSTQQQQAQVAQAKAQYDQQATVTSQANDAALLKQRAQLERSKALLSQA